MKEAFPAGRTMLCGICAGFGACAVAHRRVCPVAAGPTDRVVRSLARSRPRRRRLNPPGPIRSAPTAGGPRAFRTAGPPRSTNASAARRRASSESVAGLRRSFRISGGGAAVLRATRIRFWGDGQSATAPGGRHTAPPCAEASRRVVSRHGRIRPRFRRARARPLREFRVSSSDYTMSSKGLQMTGAG